MQQRITGPQAKRPEPQPDGTNRSLMLVSCLGVFIVMIAGLAASAFFAVTAVQKARHEAAARLAQAAGPAPPAGAEANDSKAGRPEAVEDVETDQVNLGNIESARPVIEKEAGAKSAPPPAAPATKPGRPTNAPPSAPAAKKPDFAKLDVAGEVYVTAGPRSDNPPGVIVPAADAPRWRKAVWDFCSKRPFKCSYRLETVAVSGMQLRTWGRYCESEDGLWRQYSRFENRVSSSGEPMPKEAHILYDGSQLWISVRWTDGVTRRESHPAGRSLCWNKPVPLLDRRHIAQTFLCEEEEPAAPTATIIRFPDKKRYVQVGAGFVAAMRWIEEAGGRKIPYNLTVITIDASPSFPDGFFAWDEPPEAETEILK